jgi:hypothetical protein
VQQAPDPWVKPAATLVGCIRGFNEDVLLTPYVKFLTPDLENKELTLHGTFGENGTPVVKAGDQQLTVKTRDTDSIVVQLDEQAKGPVTVELLDHASNPVPFTQWTNTFNVTGNIDNMIGPRVTASIKCRFRQDIHMLRDQFPEDPAKPPNYVAAALDADSEFKYDFTSTFETDTTKYEYLGQGTVKATLSPEGNTWLGGSVIFHLADGKVEFRITGMAEVHVTVTDKTYGSVQTYDLPYALALMFEWPVDKYGAIAAGEKPLAGTGAKATWVDFTLTGAPDDKTPAT